MKRHVFPALGAVLIVAGCASNPAHYAGTLSMQDPKYQSAECKEIRLAALDFDEKIGQRVAIGIASGLLLGPFGIPIAVMADANQNERRRVFDREVHLRCSSTPLPDSLKANPPVTASNEAAPQSR